MPDRVETKITIDTEKAPQKVIDELNLLEDMIKFFSAQKYRPDVPLGFGSLMDRYAGKMREIINDMSMAYQEKYCPAPESREGQPEDMRDIVIENMEGEINKLKHQIEELKIQIDAIPIENLINSC
jgi:hypothetical protein